MWFISGIDKFVPVLCFRANQIKPRNRKGRCLDFCPHWGIKVFIARVVKSSSYNTFSFKGKKKNDAFSSGELLSSPQLRFSKMESKACIKSVFTRSINIQLIIVNFVPISLNLFPPWSLIESGWRGNAVIVRSKFSCKCGLINRNKPNKIVAPNSYLQELLCAILNSGSYSVYI